MSKQQKKEKKSFKASLKRMFGGRFRAGSYSAVAAAVVIAIAVLVNLMVSSLPSTMTELDMTSQSLYSLSDQSKRIAASLDKYIDAGRKEARYPRLLLLRHLYSFFPSFLFRCFFI